MATSEARKRARKERAARRRAGTDAPPPSNASAKDPPAAAVVHPPDDVRAVRIRTALILLSFVYLVTVWLDGVGSNFPLKVSPRVWVYFSQIAALFPRAGMMTIDYRAEGWVCAEKKWVEVDIHPWFRIDSDTKENRFHRALQFYRKERKVMRALEDYVVDKHNASSSRPMIGGVRFLSLRIPYPKLGEHVEPYQKKELAAYPETMRHAWYWTPNSRRYERCHDRSKPPPSDRERDRDEELETGVKGPTPAPSGSDKTRAPEDAPEKDPEP